MFQIKRSTKTIELNLPEPTTFIYRFHCLSTDMMYIGMTKNPERRIEEHLSGNGSPHLLRALVDYGINDFNIEIIDTIHSDDVDVILSLEDSWIKKYNCLHPLGYNMRLNAEIVPNDEAIDLNNIVIKAKYVFHDENKIFSIGQFSQSRAYQLLTNIKENVETNKIQKKKHFNFKYIQFEVNSDQDFVVGQIYDLQLQYKFQNDLFLVTSAS